MRTFIYLCIILIFLERAFKKLCIEVLFYDNEWHIRDI
jgi:hypothetical protein